MCLSGVRGCFLPPLQTISIHTRDFSLYKSIKPPLSYNLGPNPAMTATTFSISLRTFSNLLRGTGRHQKRSLQPCYLALHTLILHLSHTLSPPFTYPMDHAFTLATCFTWCFRCFCSMLDAVGVPRYCSWFMKGMNDRKNG